MLDTDLNKSPCDQLIRQGEVEDYVLKNIPPDPDVLSVGGHKKATSSLTKGESNVEKASNKGNMTHTFGDLDDNSI